MQFKFRVEKIYKPFISLLQDVLDISVIGGIHYIIRALASARGSVPEGPKDKGDSHSRARRAREWL